MRPTLELPSYASSLNQFTDESLYLPKCMYDIFLWRYKHLQIGSCICIILTNDTLDIRMVVRWSNMVMIILCSCQCTPLWSGSLLWSAAALHCAVLKASFPCSGLDEKIHRLSKKFFRHSSIMEVRNRWPMVPDGPRWRGLIVGRWRRGPFPGSLIACGPLFTLFFHSI